MAGPISPLRVTLTDSSAGATTICTINFGFGGTLPKDGRIVVTFPSGFGVAGVLIAASPDRSIDGGFLVEPDTSSRTVTITRDGTGSVKSGYANALVSVALVANPTTPGSYRVTLKTTDAWGTIIDGPTESLPFQIVPGPLHHFELTGTPPGVTAGSPFPDSVTVTAKDAYNNTITGYTGTVSWTSTDTQAELPQ
ncbi:MAG: hypothetical protein ACUVTG_15075, partial [Candidatus Oleimicrobiaceae bacterium]